MAKKEAPKGAAAQGNGNDEFTGFTNLTSDRSAPWWNVRKGAVLIGDLKGAYDMPDQFNKGKRREFAQIKLLASTEISVKDEEGTKGVEEAEKGTLVSVGITAGLRDILEKLVPMVDAGAIVHVRITCTGARTMSKSSGNSFWPFKVESKIVKAPTMAVVPRAARTETNSVSAPSSSGEEDLAF